MTRSHLRFGTETFCRQPVYSFNLTTKPRLAMSRGHKDGSFTVYREGQFGPAGADRAHQGD